MIVTPRLIPRRCRKANLEPFAAQNAAPAVIDDGSIRVMAKLGMRCAFGFGPPLLVHDNPMRRHVLFRAARA